MSNTTPIESLASLRIGTVEYVSPDEFKILLDTDTPDNIALNTGLPRPFPRINGYLLIPIDQGFVVGQITRITIERSNFPVRKGFKDFGLIDLPFPLRKLCLHPVGTLSNKNKEFKFTRGVECFPSVGDIVLLPTDEQLRSIIEAGGNRRVYIGNSVLVSGAQVKIDPDKLFGRHLAVLGNTGSGKSCSVAGLIRWSLENAKKELADGYEELNSRFILLDPNGEYSKAFTDMQQAHVFSIEPTDAEMLLKVPLWLWNTEEWCGFTKATAKTQRPTIIHALKGMRAGILNNTLSKEHSLNIYLRTLIVSIQYSIAEGLPWSLAFPKKKSFYDLLSIWKSGIQIDDTFSDSLKQSIEKADTLLKSMIDKYGGSGFQSYTYTREDVSGLLDCISEVYYLSGGSDDLLLPIDADTPKPFYGTDFISAIQASAELLHTTEYIDSTINLIKALINDTKLKNVVSDTNITLKDWLETYIGKNEKNSLAIIDLSLLPTHVITTITAVISRLVFDTLQRYRKQTKKCLPTVLVIEEAHHFIKRYNDDTDSMGSETLCCKVFERIAREGRKFGLGMIISSQRPSELSPTVLSQCNSFLIHRISNDRDQELVGRLLPDNMRGMLKELPSLPSQNAILLGWASELPILVRMRFLPEEQRPQSNDPDFWDVWTCHEKRIVDWDVIVKEWQK